MRITTAFVDTDMESPSARALDDFIKAENRSQLPFMPGLLTTALSVAGNFIQVKTMPINGSRDLSVLGQTYTETSKLLWQTYYKERRRELKGIVVLGEGMQNVRVPRNQAVTFSRKLEQVYSGFDNRSLTNFNLYNLFYQVAASGIEEFKLFRPTVGALPQVSLQLPNQTPAIANLNLLPEGR